MKHNTRHNCIEQQIRAYTATLNTFPRRLQLAIKRLLDIVCAAVGIVLLSPLLLLLALLIRLESPGPVIFRQRRLGQYGRIFTLYKLRSMHSGAPIQLNADGSTRVVDNDPRVTRLGHFLRRSCLDELPQLFNVLRGDMSLVGPRPDPAFYLERYSGDTYNKLAMRPGLAALGQVMGRQTIGWQDRFPIEAAYIRHFSLLLDAQVLWMSVLVVWQGLGVNNGTEHAAGGIGCHTHCHQCIWFDQGQQSCPIFERHIRQVIAHRGFSLTVPLSPVHPVSQCAHVCNTIAPALPCPESQPEHLEGVAHAAAPCLRTHNPTGCMALEQLMSGWEHGE